MEINSNIKKMETFFDDDLKVKKLLNEVIPNEMDFYNADSKLKYADKVLEHLNKIESYINRIIINYNLPILTHFESKIHELKNYINSGLFYELLNQGYSVILKFIHANVSDMRPEFVDSVRKGFLGYYCFYGNGVLNPITINEFLHYIHSYIINNENFYSLIPAVRTTNEKYIVGGGISLRGISNKFGNKLYEAIISSNLNSDCIDIINLDKRMLIMARDLGHATVIEVELNNENVFVKYYIPKNNNKEMISIIKGINVNKDEFAIGNFQTTQENFVQDLCSLMNGIPTDMDRINLPFNK